MISCGPDDQPGPVVQADHWLNHGDSAKFVGGEVCASCHKDKFDHFSQTGMGLSFDHATKMKSAGDFTSSKIYDKDLDLWYNMIWKGEKMVMHEFRLLNGDTVHSRYQPIDYVVGSGQHTNSHLFSINGYLYQAPMTYYTQQGKWDLPPGYENGGNTRFSRKIGQECITCHNSYPEWVSGSENKYTNIPNGISCERCHGPGSLHVKRKLAGEVIDTSKYTDYSIVNPKKLEPELQFELCQRCHLQGNAVLAEGKTFFDFKPGMILSDHWTVFLPRYENAEDEFIMASHADRLKQSACFLKSTSGKITCITCHDPHISVKVTGKEKFNKACMGCHTQADACKEKPEVRKSKNDQCVSCHMPRSGSIDIPHVTVTDHFIRKRPVISPKEKEELRKFLGLQPVNQSVVTDEQKAKVYLYQYEKFEKAPFYLDSALLFLKRGVDPYTKPDLWIHYYFVKGDHQGMIQTVRKVGLEKILGRLKSGSPLNADAWTAYRIGEGFYTTGDLKLAETCYGQAVELAPWNLDFRIKYGAVLLAMGEGKRAADEFKFVLKEDSTIPSAWSNLGIHHLIAGKDKDAETCFRKSLSLDPDYELGMNNMIRLYYFRRDKVSFNKWMSNVKKRFPNSNFVKEMQKAAW